MIQIETPIQGRQAVGETGATVWMSPQRDLAYSFPLLVFKTFQLLENKSYTARRGVTDEELGALAKQLSLFVKHATKDPSVEAASSVNKAWIHCGLNKVDPRVLEVFGVGLTHVMLSAYFQGVREASAGHFQPFRFQHPDDFGSCFSRVNPIKRLWRAVLGCFRPARWKKA